MSLRNQHRFTGRREARGDYLLAALDTNGGLAGLPKSINTNGKRALGCQHSADLALELGRTLPDQAGVVDEPILWRLVLRLQSPEERLLCAQDLKAAQVFRR